MKDKEKLEESMNFFSIDNFEEGEGDRSLYCQIRKVIDNNDVVSLRALDLKEEDSIRDLLMEADHAIQYGENLEPNDRDYEKAEEAMNAPSPSEWSTTYCCPFNDRLADVMDKVEKTISIFCSSCHRKAPWCWI